ncbi:MAG TPA: hypothetical protein ACFYD2_07415, partial [Candidatus Avalokitesvara rifleensis]|uniref:hypothetical protein n=1 Tax=Candidatus Avalokitesvara rifleensis TaxID=3367620 RepID=UPI00402820D3
MKQWLLRTTAILSVGLLVAAGYYGSASAANVNIGGPKPGTAVYTDYWGISKEWQGDVNTILFT